MKITYRIILTGFIAGLIVAVGSICWYKIGQVAAEQNKTYETISSTIPQPLDGPKIIAEVGGVITSESTSNETKQINDTSRTFKIARYTFTSANAINIADLQGMGIASITQTSTGWIYDVTVVMEIVK